MFEIRRVSAYEYDVFVGNQWASWSRVKRAKHATFVLKGERLPHPFLKYLHTILHPHMPINMGQAQAVTLDNCALLAACGC